MRIKRIGKLVSVLTVFAAAGWAASIAVHASTLRANGKIAFTSDRDRNREIYVMNPNGSSQVRLTNNNIIDDHPAWSPDGNKIAFLSQTGVGAFGIFLMNGDGTGRTEITPVNYQPREPWRGFDFWEMSWSPDGARLVFSDGVETLVIVDADGRNRRSLTRGLFGAWSPDGSKILFLTRSGSFFYALHTIRPDGTDTRNIVPSPLPQGYSVFDSPPIWSPDGQKIAFSASDSANSEIYIANTDGSNARSVIHICAESGPEGCGFNTAYPAWSPNGRTIALAVFGHQSGSEIYVQNVDAGPALRLTDSSGSNSNPDWQPLARATTNFDFDGDGRSDISVFRPSASTWYIDRPTDGIMAAPFGLPTDTITPADFDGDARTDIAVYRTGEWIWLNSSDGTLRRAGWGIAGDVPQPADLTGDGRAELVVYRVGTWYIYNIADGLASSQQFGLATDRPVSADYDGDGRTDLAVFRDGIWYLSRSTAGFAAIQFGLPSDKLVPADYDGDGKTDLAVFRDGTWYFSGSTQGFTAFQWGVPTDVPVPADYDGNGRAEAAVFRNGVWYLRQDTGALSAISFGLSTDQPVPAAFR